MAISLDEVNRISKLARLNFSDDQKQKLQDELSSILEYVEQLKEIEGVVSMDSELDPAAVNLMRDDLAEETLPEEFLKQAPDRQGNFIKVKSVL